MNKLEQLIKTVVTTFKNDPSAPSVLLSYLTDKKVYYVSIIRYKEKFGGGKEVILSRVSEDIDMAIQLISSEFQGVFPNGH